MYLRFKIILWNILPYDKYGKNTGMYNIQCFITVVVVSLETTGFFYNTLKYMKSI